MEIREALLPLVRLVANLSAEIKEYDKRIETLAGCGKTQPHWVSHEPNSRDRIRLGGRAIAASSVSWAPDLSSGACWTNSSMCCRSS